MANTVTTVRLDGALLKQLRARAKREGRSVSSLIAFLLRRAVDDDKSKPSFVGSLPQYDAPDFAEFRAWRDELNARVMARYR